MNRMRLAVFCVCATALLLAMARMAAAQNDDPQEIERKIDRIIRQAMERRRIPGLAIAVVSGGKLVLKKGYGVKRVPDGPAPDENAVFAIGSVSKMLTAVGMMLLVEEGAVRLDDPVSRYVNGLPEAWQPITVRQFMTHTSGIPYLPRSESFAEALDRVADLPLQFPPGMRQKYTNANYAVIGQLIESVTDQSYSEFMRKRVFDPLGMNATGSWVTRLRGDLALGYHWRNDELLAGKPNVVPYGIPSGGLASNLADMLKLDTALRNNTLLKAETFRAMCVKSVPPDDPHPWRFTPGWQARSAGGREVLAKNGMVLGYGSMYQMVPNGGISVIMLWNLSGQGDDLWPAAAAILNQCFGIPPVERERPMPVFEP